MENAGRIGAEHNVQTLFLRRLDAPSYKILGAIPRALAQCPEFLVFEPIVLPEEVGEFVELLRAQVVQAFDVRERAAMAPDSDEAVVARPFFSVLLLLGFNAADQAHLDDRTHLSRLLEEDEHVDRVAIATDRRRDEAKIERKAHAFRQGLLELEMSELWIEIVFVPAAFRRLDNSVVAAALFFARGQRR